MSTLDVLPGPGWYRDPADQQTARWWDGSGWTAEVQPLPPAADPVAAPAVSITAPLIAIAEPLDVGPSLELPLTTSGPLVESAPEAEPEPAQALARPKLRLAKPRFSLPDRRLVALVLVVIVGLGGWYGWTSLQGSSQPAANPVPTHHVAPPPAKPKHVRLPKAAPSELAGLPWVVDPSTTADATRILKDEQQGGHTVAGSFYGQTPTDRFFFLGSSVKSAEVKLSATAQHARLVRDLRLILDSAIRPGATSQAPANVVAGSLTCLSGQQPQIGLVSVCQWQDSKSRVVVAAVGPATATQATLRRVLTNLSH